MEDSDVCQAVAAAAITGEPWESLASSGLASTGQCAAPGSTEGAPEGSGKGPQQGPTQQLPLRQPPAASNERPGSPRGVRYENLRAAARLEDISAEILSVGAPACKDDSLVMKGVQARVVHSLH